jgi:hypothetical protein
MFCCKRDEQNELHGPACGSGTPTKYLRNLYIVCLISGFRCDADENCILLGCCTASNGNSLPVFQDNLCVQSSRVPFGFLTLIDGTDRLSQNVGKELPLLAA